MAGKKLVLQVGVDVGNGVQNLADLKAVLDAIAKGTGATNEVFAELSKALQLSLAATKDFAENLELSYEQIAKAAVELKDLGDNGADVETQFKALASSLSLSRTQFDAIASALSEASQATSGIGGAAEGASSAIGSMGSESEKATQRLRDLVQLAKALGSDLAGAENFSNELGITANQASKAISVLKELQSVGANNDQLLQGLSEEVGISVSPDQLAKLAEAASQASASIAKLGKDTNNAASNISELVNLAKNLGTDLSGAENLANELGVTAAQANKAIALLKELQGVNATTEQQFEALSQGVGLSASQFKTLSGAIAGIGTQKSGIGGLASGVANLAFGFNNVIAAAKTLVGTLEPAFDLLIGQNEKLNSELLKSAASITATSRVFQNGVEIADPTKSIKALQGPLLDAIRQVEKDTTQLVGVTSQQTSEVFNTILSNVSQLNGQSKEFPDSIKAATALAPGLVATLSTLQLPLEQANQEIRSILTGDVGPDSTIAKQLQLSPETIRQYKAAGTLVDELVKRFEPFLSANQIASKSIAGITSNIQDLVEITARVAGQPLLDPLVEQLNQVYEFLTKNQDAITQGAISSVQVLQNLLQTAGAAIAKIAQTLLPIIVSLGDSLKNGLSAGAGAAQTSLELLGQTAVNLVTIAAPLLKIVADIVNVFSELADTDIGKTIIAAGLLTAGFVKAAGAIQIITPLVVALRAQLIATGVAFNAANAAGFAASLQAAIPAIVAFGTSLATALAPLIALGGAIALTIIVKNTNDLRVANDEIAGFQQQIDATAQQAINLATKLKALSNAQKENGSLTAEQARQQKELRAIADDQIKSYEAQISKLDELKAQFPDQAQSIENLQSQYRSLIKALQSSGGAVEVQGRQLQNLGSTADQLKEKVQGFQDVISQGAGDPAQFEQAVKGLIDATQQQLEQGLIGADEAQSRLQAIANNSQATYEQQIAAQQALTKIQEQAGEDRVNAVKQQENEVRQLQAEGRLTDAEAEQELTQIKVQELQTRLENVRKFLQAEEDAGRGNGRRAIELRQQEADIIASIAETQAEAEKKALEERLKEIERSGKEAIDAATLAETQRQTDIQKLINAGVLSEEDANQEKLQSTKERIQAELAAEQQKLNQLRALPSPTDPDERRNLEEQIRGQIQRTAQLQLNLLENERQQQLAVQQAAQQAIRDRVAIQEQASQKAIASLNREKAAQDAIANSIQRQSSLLQARQGLQQAISEYQNTVGQQESDRLQQALQLRQRIAETEDAGVKRVLQSQLQRLGVYGNEAAIANQIVRQEEARAAAAAIQQEIQFNFAKQSNELEIRRNEIAAQRAITEAKIAELKAQQEALSAQAAVEEAQQIVDPAERERAVRAAQAQVAITEQQSELASQAVTEAQAQADAQSQIAEYSRQTLEYQQATARAQSQATNESRRNAAELQRAEVSSRRVRQNLNAVSSNIGFGSNSSIGGTGSLGLTGFKEGGAPSAGTVAVVGEAGPEIVRFGSPSRVWSNDDSQKIASQLLNSSLVPMGAGVPMNAIAPASVPIAGNSIQLLKAIETLNQNLSSMGSGITVQNLQHSATYQVPKDLNAISELVDKAQINLINQLRSSLGGY